MLESLQELYGFELEFITNVVALIKLSGKSPIGFAFILRLARSFLM